MGTDTKQILMTIDADQRFAAAAGGAVRHLAESAGMGSEAATHFQAAIISACEEAFNGLTFAQPRMEVLLAQFPDRIEVTLTHRGEKAPSLGLDSVVKSAQGLFAGADRVQYEQQGDASVTRLTKYLAARA